ncbi:MAG: rod shape-determining protein [Rickettsiales bacterium]|nr:MAG: rod shape-determining protein [Rickettsiales bacterium]
MFSKIKNSMPQLSTEIGIDLGTANTVIYTSFNNSISLNQPSVVALIESEGKKIPYSFGNEAKKMIGKTPVKIEIVKPLKDGVISDFNAATEMIKKFIKESISGKTFVFGPQIIICVPTGSTPVERRAIQESAENIGAKEVWLIEETVAAAIGSDLPILETVGSMVVGLGGGTLEVGVLSLGNLVKGTSLRLAGDKNDEAILHYIKDNFNLLIGLNTAEEIKIKIGCACAPFDNSNGLSMQISGRNLNNGIPTKMTIFERQIAEALNDNINKIIDTIKKVLEEVPPELSADIQERGIYLSGGGALLKNLDYVISKVTGIPVYVAQDPLLTVVNGIKKVFNNFELYYNVLFKQN